MTGSVFNKVKKAGILSGIIVTLIVLVMVFSNFNSVSITEMTFKPVDIWSVGEGNPGAGASGFLWFGFTNLSDATGYDENSTSTLETWATANMVGKTPYGDADEFHFEYESEKTFAIIVQVRYNKTHCWETDHFNGARTDVQLTLTCTDWAVGSNINNVSGTRYETRNNTGEDYIWENFVWDNGGTGYQMADDSTFDCSEIYIEAKF